MSVLTHVMQRASNKLPGEEVEFAFPAGPVRGRTSTLEQTWTGFVPVDVAITGAVGGRWVSKKIRRRRAMADLDDTVTASQITIPVVVAFTPNEAIVLDTGLIRRTWPRNQLLRVDKGHASTAFRRTEKAVDTRFSLNGTEWMVHGRYFQAIRELAQNSSWAGTLHVA